MNVKREPQPQKSVCDYMDGGWCNFIGRCKFKSRIYEKGPRGGDRKTKSFCCMK